MGIAGLCFGFVALTLGWGSRRPGETLARDPGLYQLIGILLTLPSAFALLGALTAAPADVRVTGWLGVVGIAAGLGVGVRMLVLGLRARVPETRTGRIDREVARLTADQRNAAEAELASALETLAERRLITAEQHAAALAAPLGHLGLSQGTPRVSPEGS